MEKLKFGIIGCGRISGKHFEAIKKNNEKVQLIGVVDKDIQRAKASAEEYACNCYSNLNSFFKNEHPDVVSICTSSGTHSQIGIQAAEHGIHVLTEKPMATRYLDARRLIEACDQNNVQLHVVHQNRLNSTIQLLKTAIDKGRFGNLYDIQINVFWQRPQEYYDAASWRGTWEFDGGAFMNQASHYVDLLDYLIGDVESVMAYTGTLARKIETEDTGVVAIKFRNGALATMNVTMLAFPKNLEGSITVIGEKGTVKIGGVAVNKIEHWEFSKYDDDDKLVETSSYETQSVYGYGHTGYYANVIESILTGNEPKVCGRKGLKSLELILAIYKSAKEQTRVALPLEWS